MQMIKDVWAVMKILKLIIIKFTIFFIETNSRNIR